MQNEKLAAILKERNLTHQEVADVLGLSRPCVTMVLSGKRTLKLKTFKKLCLTFGIDPKEIW